MDYYKSKNNLKSGIKNIRQKGDKLNEEQKSSFIELIQLCKKYKTYTNLYPLEEVLSRNLNKSLHNKMMKKDDENAYGFLSEPQVELGFPFKNIDDNKNARK